MSNGTAPPIFHTGDRVKCIRGYEGNHYVEGWEGTVICSQPSTFNAAWVYPIEFDKPFPNGHRGNGTGKHPYCWNIEESHLELAKKLTPKERFQRRYANA